MKSHFAIGYMRKEILSRMTQNWNRKVRQCFQCDKTFSYKTKMKFFCSSKCYSKYHRIPGQVRKLIKEMRD